MIIFFSNAVNYYAVHLQHLIAASLLNCSFHPGFLPVTRFCVFDRNCSYLNWLQGVFNNKQKNVLANERLKRWNCGMLRTCHRCMVVISKRILFTLAGYCYLVLQSGKGNIAKIVVKLTLIYFRSAFFIFFFYKNVVCLRVEVNITL